MRFGFRELLFILVLVALPVIAWMTAFEPMNLAIAEAEREMLTKQQKLQQLQLATSRVDDLGREIDKLTKAIEVFEAKLPAEKEVEVILKEVWQVAAKHELKPRSVRADKPIKAARYSELPLKMIIVGDFDGFYAFLLDLEKHSRITRVPEMKLEKLKKGGDGQMEATFTLSIFFEPQSAAVVSASAN